MRNGSFQEYKIFAKVGNCKKPRWMRGQVIEQYPNGTTLVEAYGQKMTIPSGNVKEYRRIGYDREKQEFTELKEFVNKDWEALKQILTEAMNKFFPGEEIKIDEEEKIIYAFDDCLSISGGVFEVETISAFVETPQWSIVEYRQISATRWEPEDLEEKNVGHSSNYIGAAKLFLDAVWNIKNEGYWENKYYEMHT